MNNNILRTEKVKSRSQITQSAEHNFRIRTQNNIDSSRSHLNQILVNTLGVDTKNSSDLQLKLSEFYRGLDIKEKKDNVLMMEFVVSASPEFFEKKTSKQIQDWANHQVEFFKNEFGEQLKIGVLHLDEKTPHLHFMIGTEIKSVKKYKNQKGEFFKETWSLNAKRYDPDFLRELHTRHAEWNKKFGLKRGVNGSMRKHKTLKEFYSMVDKALNSDYQKQIEKSLDSLDRNFFGSVSIDEIKKKFQPLINNVLKQNKALREKYALDLKEWALDLANKEAQLKTELEDAKARKEVYKEAINSKMDDADLLYKYKTEIRKLEEENNRLRRKYEPEQPNYKKSNNDPNKHRI